MIETTGETFKKQYSGPKRCSVYKKKAADLRASYPVWNRNLACFVLFNSEITKAINKSGHGFTADIKCVMQFTSYAAATDYKHHVIEAWLQERVADRSMSLRQRIATTLNRAKFTATAADAMAAQTRMALHEVNKLMPKGDVDEVYTYHANMSFLCAKLEVIRKEINSLLGDWDNAAHTIMQSPTMPAAKPKKGKRNA